MNVIHPSCWTPHESLRVDVRVKYQLQNNILGEYTTSETFQFGDFQLCNVGTGGNGNGGGFTNGNSNPIDLTPTITPNPSSGNTQVNFELAND